MMLIQVIVLHVIIGLVSVWIQPVLGHARLYEPPGRSTMWRRGFDTPHNYQDNELYCGGFQHQLKLGYKCGLCGDPHDGVRDNETGGKYAKGIITRTYTQGQEVTFQVDVTANHKGYFEFKVCATNNPRAKETQECFDRHPLTLADGSGTRYHIPPTSNIMNVRLLLPPGLVCEFCVVQMRYHAGNSWGTEPNGRSCVGCGPQEEFYGCSDIKIVPTGYRNPNVQQQLSPEGIGPGTNTHGGVNNADRTNGVYPNTRPSTQNNAPKIQNDVETLVAQQQNLYISTGISTPSVGNDHRGSDIRHQGNQNPVPTGASGENLICKGTNNQSNLDQWCQVNCQSGYCPRSHCSCVIGQGVSNGERPVGCRGTGAYAGVPGMDKWCQVNCAAGDCPSSHCVC